MKILRPLFVFAISILTSTSTQGQGLVQTISGTVKNQISKTALVGASVSIFKSEQLVAGSVTDSLGNFVIQNVAPDRYKLSISFTGFSSFEDELLVISGKQSIVNLSLSESSTILQTVEITAYSNETDAGVTSISLEKSLRVPANFFDPVRMATSYPGVIATNDQSNSIVVKGYSPNGLLWRLQGLDIVGPNHTANAGTFTDKPAANGGGVNILSAQLLDKTDFYSGAFPASYGNALSGVMDMKLRAGNKNKMQYTAQASLIGLDIAAEGPIDKSHRTSFVANYRYSTVGLLSQMGVNFGDEIINYQDFSFHLDQQQKKGGNLSVFGFGGLSSNEFKAKPVDEWKEEKDRNDIDYDGKVYGIGFVNEFKSFDRLNLSVGGSLSGQTQERNAQSAVVPYPYIYSDKYSNDKLLFSSFLKALYQLSSKGTLETGIMVNYLDSKLVSTIVTPLYFDIFYPSVDGKVSGLMLQPYATWTQRFGTSWKLNAGLRYVNFTYNNATSVEPRASLAHYFPKGSLTLSYGLTGQWQQLQTYLQLGNQDLKLTKAHQFSTEFKYVFAKDLKVVSNVYYHQVFDVPGQPFTLNYSTLNQFEDFSRQGLQNNGKGLNYGVEAYVEKKYYSQIYFMVSGSLYRSEYNAIGYYTRFNGRFTSSFLAGKEWQKKRNTFGLNSRILYLGGLREAPIDPALSALIGSTQYNYQNGYSQQLPDYFRMDLRLSWRKNKPGYTRTFALDIQNLLNTQNVAYNYYDTYLQAVKTKFQLGLIPILVYRVEF
ncbi:MAG: TonB-dependent receptor [Bacteroidia bacterium]|nr:TonB-dependent receptor [Bacteroidia bacterium]